MSRKINVLYQNKPCYDIYIEDSFGALADALEPFALTDRKVCIITDSNVDPLYGAEVEDMKYVSVMYSRQEKKARPLIR